MPFTIKQKEVLKEKWVSSLQCFIIQEMSYFKIFKV